MNNIKETHESTPVEVNNRVLEKKGKQAILDVLDVVEAGIDFDTKIDEFNSHIDSKKVEYNQYLSNFAPTEEEPEPKEFAIEYNDDDVNSLYINLMEEDIITIVGNKVYNICSDKKHKILLKLEYSDNNPIDLKAIIDKIRWYY